MQTNFNVVLTGLDGQPLKDQTGKDQTAGSILAASLVSVSKGQILKFYDWAKKMYNAEPINLDREDRKTLKEFVEQNDQITILAKAQIIEILERD